MMPFPWGKRTYIMGIVNVTPDSFSGDGVIEGARAVTHAIAQLERGSDIIDIGGESTRPGHRRIDDATEIARTIPVIDALRASGDLRVREATISIDTYKPAVARAACEAGATIVNSVWGMPDDVLDVAGEYHASVVIMHNKEKAEYSVPAGRSPEVAVMDEVLAFLHEAARRSVNRGIPQEQVILDPGIGFGKTAEHNIAVLRQLPRLVALGFPTLLGTSRKSTIGKLTGKEQPDERVFGTAATTALAVAAGIDIVRVHDVAQTRDVLAVADAVVRNWRPEYWEG